MSWSIVRAMLASAILAAAGSYGALAAEGDNAGAETHCVVTVLDEMPNGALVMSEPVCFGTFAEAMASASGGSVQLPLDTQGAILFDDPNLAASISAFTRGIHFNGFNGNGNSISVAGSSCSGWWNTPASWDNRISSTYNGCARLSHYNDPNKGGSSENTYGTGTTDNLGSLNNRVESVSYHSG